MALLTGLRDENKISGSQYYDLYPTSDLVHWLYSSPTIHKPGNLLHPITDYTGSLAYATSKAITDFLKPLVGKTSYHIKNTTTFSKELKDLRVEKNVPIQKAMELIRKKLEEDKKLSD